MASAVEYGSGYRIMVVAHCCFFKACVEAPCGTTYMTEIHRYGRYTAQKDAERLIQQLEEEMKREALPR